MLSTLALTLFLCIVLSGVLASFVVFMEWVLYGLTPDRWGLAVRFGDAVAMIGLIGLGWIATHARVLL